MSKNYKAVCDYYHETQETEFQICHYLNKNRPEIFIKQGILFEIQVDSQYAKNDIVLTKILPTREKIVITKVEFEIGATQIEWDYELPRHKWQALNLITRKMYGKTFSLFIKSSRTYNSFFAIDCRNDFVQKNFGDTEVLNHSLNFETDSEFYRIYWDDLPQHQYIDDKMTKSFVNGNICIIENTSDWSQFYRFIWRRFIEIEKGS